MTHVGYPYPCWALSMMWIGCSSKASCASRMLLYSSWLLWVRTSCWWMLWRVGHCLLSQWTWIYWGQCWCVRPGAQHTCDIQIGATTSERIYRRQYIVGLPLLGHVYSEVIVILIDAHFLLVSYTSILGLYISVIWWRVCTLTSLYYCYPTFLSHYTIFRWPW